MKTKGKELVEISDICDEFYCCSQYQYLLEQHNSNFIEVKIYIKKNFTLVYRSKVTIGHEGELTK